MTGKWTGCLAAVMMLGACNSAPEPEAPKEEPPVLIKAGQWDLTWKITGYNHPGVTAEEYAAHVGKSRQQSVCLAVTPDGMPDADELAGKDGRKCAYSDVTLRKGRFIATLSCASGAGTSTILAEGNYTADSLTLGLSTTKLDAKGGATLRTTADLTGKRTGDCAPKG
jgi:hypothetical protein